MCTLLGRADAGAWILASTSDDPYTVQNQVVCECTSPYSYLAVRVVVDDAPHGVPWNHMLTRGLNAAGFAYTYAYVHEAGNEEGPVQAWAPKILAHCATVENAVEFMRASLGQILSGNYLLCDAGGNAAAVEVSRAQIQVAPVEEGRVACTNVWRFLPASPIHAWGADTAAQRADRARLLLRDGPAALSALLEMTRDHIDGGTDANRPYGISICNHGQQEGTISAELLDPRGLCLWWTYGWPCGEVRGYETPTRVPWGRFFGFNVANVQASGEVTTLDGKITPLGVQLIGGVANPLH